MSTKKVQAPLGIAQDAHNVVHGSRQSDYGDKHTNFTQSAMIISGILAAKLKEPLTANDVAHLMIGMKLARVSKSPAHYDSLLDIIGYAICANALNTTPATHAHAVLHAHVESASNI